MGFPAGNGTDVQAREGYSTARLEQSAGGREQWGGGGGAGAGPRRPHTRTEKHFSDPRRSLSES